MAQINVRNSQRVYTADIILSTDQQRIFVKVTIHNNKCENMTWIYSRHQRHNVSEIFLKKLLRKPNTNKKIEKTNK